MPKTLFYPPVYLGWPTSDPPFGQAPVSVSQQSRLPAAAAAPVIRRLTVPACRIVDIFFDTQTAWSTTGTAIGTVGISGAGNEAVFAGGVDCKLPGRQRPVFTNAQATALIDTLNAERNEVQIMITPSVTSPAGITWVTLVIAPL